MTRRAQVADGEDDSSQKENSGVPLRMYSEKVKKEKMKKEKAARVASDNEEDELEGEQEQEPNVQDSVDHEESDVAGETENSEREEAGEGEESDAEGEGSPNGHKRARLNGEGSSRPVKKEKNKGKMRPVTLPRGADG